MPVTVKVAGLATLGDALRSMGADMLLKTARRMTNAGAQVVKKRAIAKAPQSAQVHQLGRRKDQVVNPGNLKRNIVVRRIRPRTPGREDYTVGVRHGSGKAPRDAFYWRFIEFGTVKMGARPFLRPAFDGGKGEAVEAMADRGRRDIKISQTKAANRFKAPMRTSRGR
jgi:HK97 gp10 family phage protein